MPRIAALLMLRSTMKTVSAPASRSFRGSLPHLCVPKTSSLLITLANRLTLTAMIAPLCFFLTLFASPFKSKSRLEAENAALRHQVIVLQRRVRGRVQLTNGDRLFLVQLYRWFPSVLNAITIIRPETLIRWHRAGFRRYWRWKSRPLGGRPQIDADLRALIRRMSAENPLWGAAHPWRVAQARLRGRSVQRREWDGPAVLLPPTTRRVGWGL